MQQGHGREGKSMFDYICGTCKAVFTMPENDYEVSHGCMYCGQDVERAVPCAHCSSLMPDSQAKFGLCKQCETDLLNGFKTYLAGVEAIYGSGGVCYLEERMDGEYWERWRELK